MYKPVDVVRDDAMKFLDLGVENCKKSLAVEIMRTLQCMITTQTKQRLSPVINLNLPPTWNAITARTPVLPPCCCFARLHDLSPRYRLRLCKRTSENMRIITASCFQNGVPISCGHSD